MLLMYLGQFGVFKGSEKLVRFDQQYPGMANDPKDGCVILDGSLVEKRGQTHALAVFITRDSIAHSERPLNQP